VKLYWATSDQYYIKTGVLFRDYTFFADNSKTYKIILRTVAAKEEVGSNKATKARFFVLDDERPLELLGENALVIRFQYRELTAAGVKRYEAGGGSNTAKQDKINQHIMDAVLEGLDNPHLKGFLSVYSKNDRPLLLHQLSRFTAKNSRDFFIHKNLKKFLSEQLDYFIKSEVISIDTLERERFLDRHITRAKVVREIGGRIIDFLAQIEDFQKKLWEKKKFVLKTEYVITTDRVPEEFYPEILKNNKQTAEWQALGFGKAPSKTGLNEKKLPIDTRHFAEDFKERLLEKLTEAADLDDLLDGLMIKSENWQGLNLLIGKYRERVKCIYIDPPYNTGGDGFLYKDQYQHSAWLSMIQNRLDLSSEYSMIAGSILVSIDDIEFENLRRMIGNTFGSENFVDTIIWKKRYGGGAKEKHLVSLHEYVLFFARDINQIGPLFVPLSGESIRRYYKNKDENFPVRGPYRTHPLEATKSVDVRSNLIFPIIAPDGVEIWPERQWWWDRQRVEDARKANELEFSKSGNRWTVHTKQYLLDENGVQRKAKPFSIIDNVYTQHGASEIGALFGDSRAYTFPKPSLLIVQLLHIAQLNAEEIAMDFFPGSGTTAHAVMKLNSEDGGKRKFILIEMANYFDTVMIPRIKKVAYSFNWKDGKPKDIDGNGVFFKYQVLEQYEDSLDNLELKENRDALSLFGNDYLLKYFLDFESRGNASLVNFEHFKKPSSYKLKVNVEEVGEPEEVLVDLPETFHYLLGLKVKKIKVRKDKGRKYLFILGEKGGRNIAVVWREYDDDWTKPAFQKDKEFIIQEIQGWAPQVVYVNGQSALTPKIGGHTAEVRAIEPEFRKRMVDAS